MRVGLSPLQAGGDFKETIRECERAEAAGFDSVWLGEHHNNTLLYPTPLLGLAAIASRTRRLRLGTGVLLLPLHHPLAVAASRGIPATDIRQTRWVRPSASWKHRIWRRQLAGSPRMIRS